MLNVISSELRKMRRPSILASTFLIIGTLSIGLTSFIFLRNNQQTYREIVKFDGATSSYAMVTAFMGFVALVIFASQTAQEYTFGTLRNLLVRQPNRKILFTGKFLAMSLFAVMYAAFTFALNVGLSFALANYKHLDTHLWLSSQGITHTATFLLNTTLAMIGYGSFGMAIGMILKSPMGAISASLLWFLVIEGLIGAIEKKVSSWLPGNALAVVNEGGIAHFSYSQGLAVATTYAVVLMGFSGYLFLTRDVAQ